MNLERIRIKISDIFNNLQICKTPLVRFERENIGYLKPCEGDDYIEIIPLEDFEGVTVWVKCSECDECGWKKITITPCESDVDCPNCSTCKEDGYCLSLCKDDEFCVGNKCVECDGEHPCPSNKVCIDGKCNCPADKPIWNGKICVACSTDEQCGKCHKCTDEGCKPKDCICDPESGNCVECMNSGDCKSKDPNMCCGPNHKCQCCTGYTWSYSENKCIKGPDCVTDGDCNDPCKYCDHGTCKPVVCPDGFTCYLGDCVKICDCKNGGCPDGYTCMPYGDICICVLCEGTCTEDTDCEKGCRCGKLKKCIPNPCQGSCKNGNECGNGCGCNKDGKCVPCDSLDCVTGDCGKVKGCTCNENSKCIDADDECTGACTSPLDCKGINCTCYKGKCISCKNFPCEDGQCDKIPGCECADGTNCSGSNKDCTDTFTFTKDGCGAKVELTLKNKCTCKDIIFKSKYIPLASTLPPNNSSNQDIKYFNGTYYLELRKNVSGQPLLSETEYEEIAQNDLPISGMVEIRTRYFLEKVSNGDDNGFIDLVPAKFDLVNKAKIQYALTLTGLYEEFGDEDIIKKIEVSIVLSEDLKLPNGCIYKKGTVLSTIDCNSQICEFVSGMTQTTFLSSESFVDPLIKIYRTTNDIFTTPYRKLYKIPVSTGKYTDKLYGPDDFILTKQILIPDEGLLFGNQSYIAKNDCACENYASLGKVINCEPATLGYSLSNCNGTITLTGFTPNCSTNKDLSYYDASNADILHSQAYWKLFINGKEVATFRYYGDPVGGEIKDVVTKQSISGWTYTNWETDSASRSNTKWIKSIDSIQFKMYYGEVMVCDNINEQIENSVPLPTHNTVCPNVTSMNYYDLIDKVSNGFTVTSVSASDINGNSVYVEDAGSKFKVHAPFGVITNIRVIYSTGCTKEYAIKESCCGTFSVSAEATYSNPGCGGNVTLSAIIVGGAKSITYQWTLPDGSKRTGQNITLEEGYDNGSYQVEATDGSNCVSRATVDVNVLGIEYTKPEDQSICNGSSATLSITGTTGANLQYRIGTNPIQSLIIPGVITTSALTENTVISFIEIGYNSCSRILNETTILTVVENAVASITETNTQQCIGNTPSVEITATPQSIVDYKINNVVGQIQIGTDGIENIPLPNSSGTYLVQVVKVTLGSCVNNITGQTINILIQDSPSVNILPNSYQCSTSGGGGFIYEFIFEVSNYSGTPSVNVGVLTLISGNQYKVTGIPTGQSCTITASNGTCIITKQSQSYNCDCNSIVIPQPIPEQAIYTYCDGSAVPELAVTVAVGCRADWYNSQIGGTLVASNSLTYTPEAPETGMSAFYWVEAIDLISGCKSNRVSVAVENSELPNAEFSANTANKYCLGNTVYFNIPYQIQSTFLWEVENGTIQGSNTGTGITVLLDEIGELSVKLTVTNVDGCTDDKTETYQVGNLTYTIDAYNCLLDKAVMHLGGIVGHTYKATFTRPGGSTKIFRGLSGGGTHDIYALSNSHYNVSVTDEDGKGCITVLSDYVVNCCDILTLNATATLEEEGCHDEPDGGDIQIDLYCNYPINPGYNIRVQVFIEHGVESTRIVNYVEDMSERDCVHRYIKIDSNTLLYYPSKLAATNNNLRVKFYRTDTNELLYDEIILTFDADDC